MSAAVDTPPLVAVIDDDASVREALRGLFRSVGLEVEVFSTTEDYVRRLSRTRPNCLVLDVRLPGRSGLEFQAELNKVSGRPQIIFISGHADVPMSVRAMKAGAVEFLTKPVRDQDLLDAVHLAIARDRMQRLSEQRIQQAQSDFASLTARERDVLKQVVVGRRNKDIAVSLGLSEATVKLHRSNLMQKLKAQSLVELVRVADLFNGAEADSTNG